MLELRHLNEWMGNIIAWCWLSSLVFMLVSWFFFISGTQLPVWGQMDYLVVDHRDWFLFEAITQSLSSSLLVSPCILSPFLSPSCPQTSFTSMSVNEINAMMDTKTVTSFLLCASYLPLSLLIVKQVPGGLKAQEPGRLYVNEQSLFMSYMKGAAVKWRLDVAVVDGFDHVWGFMLHCLY